MNLKSIKEYLPSNIIIISTILIGVCNFTYSQQLINLACDTTVSRSITFQPNEKVSKDAFVRSLIHHTDFTNQNYGEATNLRTVTWTGNGRLDISRSFFDFNGLKSYGSTEIDSAFLTLYTYESTGDGGGQSGANEADIHLITTNWNEDSINWNNQPSYSTTHKVNLATNNSRENFKIDLTNLVKEYLANSSSYFGFMLKIKNEFTYRSRNYASSNYPDRSKHPQLKIYLKPSAQQEQMALSIEDNLSITDPRKGLILTSPSGGCFMLKVEDDGRLTSEMIACPD